MTLGPEETVVVVVSPVAQGVLGPLLATALIIGVVASAAHVWTWPRAHDWALAVLAVPTFLLLCARSLRWWSQRVTVTSDRVIETAGVLRRRLTSVEFASLGAVHVHQERWDRVLRRGSVVLEVVNDPVVLHRVRRPDVFVRVVESVRHPIAPSREESSGPGVASGAPDNRADVRDDDAALRWRHLFGDGGRYS